MKPLRKNQRSYIRSLVYISTMIMWGTATQTFSIYAHNFSAELSSQRRTTKPKKKCDNSSSITKAKQVKVTVVTILSGIIIFFVFVARSNQECLQGIRPKHKGKSPLPQVPSDEMKVTTLKDQQKSKRNIEKEPSDEENFKLLEACTAGQLGMVQDLLSQGANINCTNARGYTLLHLACCNGNAKIIAYLIANGVNVNCTTKIGSTPLHLASVGGHLEAVECLVQQGKADRTLKTSKGKTALELAQGPNKQEIVNFLESSHQKPKTKIYIPILSTFLSYIFGHLFDDHLT